MKLRIKGSSIRLRLTKTEVARIGEGLDVTETLAFGGGIELRYVLEPSCDATTLEATFRDSTVRVRIPRERALNWSRSEEVSILSSGDSGPLILVEKDFVCLKPRSHDLREFENESDLFANPREAHGSCG